MSTKFAKHTVVKPLPEQEDRARSGGSVAVPARKSPRQAIRQFAPSSSSTTRQSTACQDQRVPVTPAPSEAENDRTEQTTKRQHLEGSGIVEKHPSALLGQPLQRSAANLVTVDRRRQRERRGCDGRGGNR
eukprot:scaffold341_cov154-Ochromonas_danica.AAC.7